MILRLATVVLFLIAPGCASDRYLTKEQDEEMRANCEPHSCVVVPAPVWAQIEAMLKRLRTF